MTVRCLGISILGIILPISATAGQVYYDHAKVTKVEPITRTVHVPEQHRECWMEEVTTTRQPNTTASTIVGGVVGGLVGKQFGKGHGKDAATIAGTLIGGSVGHEVANQNRSTQVNQQQRCRVVDTGYDEERVTGYQVAYQYNGENYHIRTQKDPGETIKVRVKTSVTPVVGQ